MLYFVSCSICALSIHYYLPTFRVNAKPSQMGIWISVTTSAKLVEASNTRWNASSPFLASTILIVVIESIGKVKEGMYMRGHVIKKEEDKKNKTT